MLWTYHFSLTLGWLIIVFFYNTLSWLFILSSFLPFHPPTTININITLPLSSFYFDYSYPHPLIINLLFSLTLYIFYHIKRLLLSLFLNFFLVSLLYVDEFSRSLELYYYSPLSLSLSLLFCVIFFIYLCFISLI